MPDLERLRAYAEINEEVKEIRARDKELTSQREQMSQDIYEEMSREGMLSLKILPDGWERAVTISTTRKLRPNIPAGTMSEVCQLLKANGHGAIVKESVNHQTLASWLKEQPVDDQGMPVLDGMQGTITVFEQFGLSVRKA